MNKEIVELGRKFKECKLKADQLKADLDAANAEWSEVENDLIEAMKDEGVGSIKIDGVGLLMMRRKSYLSVNAANKPTFFEYLQASGNGDLLKLDVHNATLTAFLKKHQEELSVQFQAGGLSAEQAALLASVEGCEDAVKAVGKPLDEMAADEIAMKLLKSRGAAVFEKTDIALKG